MLTYIIVTAGFVAFVLLCAFLADGADADAIDKDARYVLSLAKQHKNTRPYTRLLEEANGSDYLLKVTKRMIELDHTVIIT